MNKKILLVIAVFAAAALTARAQNLVTNPGFETGDFTGWTQFGDTSFSGVATISPDGTPPHSGNFLAYFGPTSSNGGINQSITGTVMGTSYNISFWLANSDPIANDNITVTFGSATLLTLTNSAPFGFTQFSYTVAASQNNALLQFSMFNPPDYWDLDDISVKEVPEPGTLGLITLGALGLVGALRKRLV